MRIKNVSEWLEYSARSFPAKVAFSDGTSCMTFAELRNAARHIASDLIKRGIIGQPVLIVMGNEPKSIAAFFGCAYSRNYYTPLDVKMPRERMSKILNTLQPKIIISSADCLELAESLAEDRPIISYDDVQKVDAADEIMKIANESIEHDILYVLFTSGSTGMPKGVTVPHKAVINYIDWFTREFDIDETVIFGNQAPLFFDLSIQDVYATVKAGCTTHLLNQKLFSFPSKLMKYMCEKEINTIVWVPTALCIVANLRGLKVKCLPPIKKVLFCGEVMPNKQLNQWRSAYPDAMFVNLYGPTEACDAMMYYKVEREFDDDDKLPLGRAIDNVEVLVLDDNDKLVEGNRLGELCIRGTALAYGYYNDETKTTESFVRNPLNPSCNEIIYRTGDLVHYNEQGELIYDCRKDFQIKHSGHRIELGEIESVAGSVNGIDMCACIYDKEIEQILMFYCGSLDESAVKKELKDLLPPYMVPGKIEKRMSMPRTGSGKIDRTALHLCQISKT